MLTLIRGNVLTSLMTNFFYILILLFSLFSRDSFSFTDEEYLNSLSQEQLQYMHSLTDDFSQNPCDFYDSLTLFNKIGIRGRVCKTRQVLTKIINKQGEKKCVMADSFAWQFNSGAGHFVYARYDYARKYTVLFESGNCEDEKMPNQAMSFLFKSKHLDVKKFVFLGEKIIRGGAEFNPLAGVPELNPIRLRIGTFGVVLKRQMLIRKKANEMIYYRESKESLEKEAGLGIAFLPTFYELIKTENKGEGDGLAYLFEGNSSAIDDKQAIIFTENLGFDSNIITPISSETKNLYHDFKGWRRFHRIIGVFSFQKDFSSQKLAIENGKNKQQHMTQDELREVKKWSFWGKKEAFNFHIHSIQSGEDTKLEDMNNINISIGISDKHTFQDEFYFLSNKSSQEGYLKLIDRCVGKNLTKNLKYKISSGQLLVNDRKLLMNCFFSLNRQDIMNILKLTQHDNKMEFFKNILYVLKLDKRNYGKGRYGFPEIKSPEAFNEILNENAFRKRFQGKPTTQLFYSEYHVIRQLRKFFNKLKQVNNGDPLKRKEKFFMAIHSLVKLKGSKPYVHALGGLLRYLNSRRGKGNPIFNKSSIYFDDKEIFYYLRGRPEENRNQWRRINNSHGLNYWNMDKILWQ